MSIKHFLTCAGAGATCGDSGRRRAGLPGGSGGHGERSRSQRQLLLESVFNDVHLYNGAPFNGAPFNGAPFNGAPLSKRHL